MPRFLHHLPPAALAAEEAAQVAWERCPRCTGSGVCSVGRPGSGALVQCRRCLGAGRCEGRQGEVSGEFTHTTNTEEAEADTPRWNGSDWGSDKEMMEGVELEACTSRRRVIGAMHRHCLAVAGPLLRPREVCWRVGTFA